MKTSGAPRLERAIAILVLAFFLCYVGSCAHTFATCDGHVVRNWANWPVCVGERK